MSGAVILSVGFVASSIVSAIVVSFATNRVLWAWICVYATILQLVVRVLLEAFNV